MIQAFRSPKWFWPLTLLAILIQILHVFTMEYFWGLELLRPVILWILYSEQTLNTRQRLRKVFFNWLFYLIILLAGVIIRTTVYVDFENDPNRPDLLYNLKQPISTLQRIGQLSIQDFINNLFGAWYQTFEPFSIKLTDRVFLFSLLIAFLAGGLIFAYLSRIQPSQEVQESDRKNWVKQA